MRSIADHGGPEASDGPPEFSIILPTRDRPHLVAEAIASVVAQTDPSWELIVVDDNGDVPVVAPGDPRIVVVRRPGTGGPAAARNTGLAHARGRFIAFLDDDDQFEPDRLAAASAGRTHHPVTICGTRFLDEHTGSTRTLDGDVSDAILDGPTPCLGATTVLRSICPPFDERWHGVEDVEWWMRLSRIATVHTIDHVGYLVRRHDGPRHLNDRRSRLDENMALLADQKAWFDAHPAAAAHRWKRIGILAETLGDARLARQAYRRSHGLSPSAATRWHLVRMTVPATLRVPLRHTLGTLTRRAANTPRPRRPVRDGRLDAGTAAPAAPAEHPHDRSGDDDVRSPGPAATDAA